jgi:type I restriction-modification system DNA methylase subunit
MDKSQYFSILKQLHDICRDNPAPSLTGMDAYNEIMNYLYLRHLSDKNKNNILKKLYETYCTDKHIEEDKKNSELNKIASKSGMKQEIYYEKLSQLFLPGLLDQERNSDISFAKIMGSELQNFKLDIGRLTNIVHKDETTTVTDGGQKAQKLINKLYQDDFLPTINGKFNIQMFPYDAVGEGFEKFMSDAGSKGGNWGQYFTNPQLINWIINKCGIDDNHNVIDPFAGSGGFILQVKKNTKVKPENIYAHENDDKIYKFLKFNSNIAGLEMDNIEKGDTFDYSDYLKQNVNKFDRIFTNPPFGMSIDILLSTEDKTKFWSVLKSGKQTIKDSMGLAVYAIYKMLKDKGIAGFVCERGILNNGTEKNSWQKKLRKFLMEKSSITDILLLPKGIFSHTTFDTAVVIMEKGTPTKEINFHQGFFMEQDKGKSNKVMHVKENILTITLKQIVNKDWSLKYDDYIDKVEELYEGIQYKSITYICSISKSSRKAGVATDDGLYPFYSSSPIIKKSNYNDFNGEYIIIGNGGNGSCHYINGIFSCSADNFILKLTNNIISTKFLYYYIKTKFNELQNLYTGNGLKHLTLTNLPKFKIPILPLEHQNNIVTEMDKLFEADCKLLDKLVSKFKDYDLFKLLLNENYESFNDLIELYNDIMWAEAFYDRLNKKYKNLLIQQCFNKVPTKEMKLGDLVTIKRGKSLPKTKIIKGDYPVISGTKNILNYHNTFNYDANNTIFMARVGSAGDVLIQTGKVYLTDLSFAIEPKKNINNIFLFLYLDINYKTVKKLCSSNGAPNINATILLNKLNICIPSIEDQEKVVKMIEKINNEDSVLNNQIKSLKETIINLYECVEQTINSDNKENNDELEDDYDEELEEDYDEELDEDDEVEEVEEKDDELKLDEESEEESEELDEVEIKGKVYFMKDKTIYIKLKDGTKGNIYGKLNASNKLEKINSL